MPTLFTKELDRMGFGMPAPQSLFFPPGLPRASCGVRRESGGGFHKASDFVKSLDDSEVELDNGNNIC